MASAEELAFLSRIRERPEEDGPRLIFADWLDERGDVRGEFIRVQCALARLAANDPRRDDWEKRESELKDKFSPIWTASLRGLVSGCEYRRGLIESVTVDAPAFVERGKEIFRHGPIRRVRFLEAASCFAALVDSPHLSLVREIDLCSAGIGNGGVAQLARSRRLATLQYLHLGFNDLTDQGLRALADMPQLGNLRELHLPDNRQIGTPGLRALADSPHLDNLRHLDLSGNGLNETALKVLINGESLKRLDSLALSGNNIGDGGVEALARSELLRRMLAASPILNLSRNNIGPIGARALAESPIIAGLEELCLDDNAIGDAGLALLAKSPYLHVKRLLVAGNRIGDAGTMGLARSTLPESLVYLDLTRNFITADSVEAVMSAGRAQNWQKEIDVRHDPGLHLRQPALPGRVNPA